MIKTAGRSKTQEQIWYGQITEKRLYPLYNRFENWFIKVREMRVDPTIAIARDLLIASIHSAEWIVEGSPAAPATAVDYVNTEIQKWRGHLITTGVAGLIDFGWQAYEKIYGLNPDQSLKIVKLKSLVPDKTEILVDPDNGNFTGILQEMDWIELSLQEVLLLNWQIDGTDWYGRPLMKNVEQSYGDWNDSNTSANRYDRKIAGSHWVIKYPPGSTKINGANKDNFEIAKDLINALEYSTGVAIPSYVETFIEELNKDAPDAWDIELLGDSSNQQQNFVDRQRYLDSLKVRGFGFPERAIIEGQFGTKAEAGVHQNIAMSIIDERHQQFLNGINEYLISDLITFTYGEEFVGTVTVVPTSVSDHMQVLLKELYDKILDNPEAGADEIARLDVDNIRENLGVPANADLLMVD